MQRLGNGTLGTVQPIYATRRSPLVKACMQGSLALMLELLESGQGIDEQDSKGRTALHHAATKGNVVAAAWLIAHGCSTNIVDASGCTAFEAAYVAGHWELARFLLLCNFHEIRAKYLSPITMKLATEDFKYFCILVDTALPLHCCTESEFKEGVAKAVIFWRKGDWEDAVVQLVLAGRTHLGWSVVTDADGMIDDLISSHVEVHDDLLRDLFFKLNPGACEVDDYCKFGLSFAYLLAFTSELYLLNFGNAARNIDSSTPLAKRAFWYAEVAKRILLFTFVGCAPHPLTILADEVALGKINDAPLVARMALALCHRVLASLTNDQCAKQGDRPNGIVACRKALELSTVACKCHLYDSNITVRGHIFMKLVRHYSGAPFLAMAMLLDAMRCILFWTPRLSEEPVAAAKALLVHWCDYGFAMMCLNDALPNGLRYVRVSDLHDAAKRAKLSQPNPSTATLSDYWLTFKHSVNGMGLSHDSLICGTRAEVSIELCGNPDCPTAHKPHNLLQKCSACKLVYYCCYACQKADWKSHKAVCSGVAKNRQTNQAPENTFQLS